MGAASDGTPRPGSEDHCDTIGEGLYFQCPRTWTSPVDGTPIKLTDYNPASPTYLQQVSPDDFRGNVIHIDISSNNCTHCRIQAPWLANVEEMYEGRDYVSITVFTLNYVGVTPIPPASCGLYIEAWADLYGIDGPIVCDIDLNGDNHGDVSWQLDWAQCGGTPRNFFYDQSFILYNRMCGRPANQQGFENTLVNEINPESCE